MKDILFFEKIRMADIARVGGKNASLGEMYNQLNAMGIAVPNGFAITAEVYRNFLNANNLQQRIKLLLDGLDTENYTNLSIIGEAIRTLIMNASLTMEVREAIAGAYKELSALCGEKELDVAVRSSATAEDLPSASFAGRMESFLNIRGHGQLLDAVHLCYASLFTDRAIKYRNDMGFAKMDIAISVGVQQMVRSDKASSGVAFTIDPDSGFENAIVINSSWGLGENVVQGRVTPDEWWVFKPSLKNQSKNPIIKRALGRKEFKLLYAEGSSNLKASETTLNTDTPPELQRQFSLSDKEVVELASWCLQIETHYNRAMDIEWAKDGASNRLFIVQARPETIHGAKKGTVHRIYSMKEKGTIITRGIALGDKIISGRARILNSPGEGDQLKEGEILVTDITNPDWDPVLKRAGGIVTNKGGRTSHAAIVARELGTVAVVGCGDAKETIREGQEITVSCAEGKEGFVYKGKLEWEVAEKDFSNLPDPKTAPMLILANPDRAFHLASFPNRGVGLMRLEFAISNSIQIHPLALCKPEKITDPVISNAIAKLIQGHVSGRDYFVQKLAESVAQVAAAFYPQEVIVRLSDFKSNEYANLIGGEFFEPREENPMLGLRGASRYYSDFYKEGFALECRAMKMVRQDMGLHNVKLMIPFCRTVEEGEKVLEALRNNGLVRGEDGLEIYVMIEIPSNVILAEQFAERFDGFSIGSNDLTQLTLGLDRDSSLVDYLFNEENPAVKELVARTIRAAKKCGIKVGLCGQAPSDLPEYAKFLVGEGIDSISFNPDALIKGIENIVEAERSVKATV